MVRRGTRPLWKRILYLEYLACTELHEITLEGWPTLIICILGSPLACLFLLGWLAKRVYNMAVSPIQRKRREPCGGIKLKGTNTGRPRLGWLRRRRSLSDMRKSMNEGEKCALLRLPPEIRTMIWKEVFDVPEDLEIGVDNRRSRLFAAPVPKDVFCLHGSDDVPSEASFCLHSGRTCTGYDKDKIPRAHNLLILSKLNRSLYVCLKGNVDLG